MDGTAVYAPSSQVIFDQLAATYVLFAFNEAVVLRVTKELKVWKAIVLGISLCDVLHLHASWRVMGTEVFTSPWLWRPEDWLAVGSVWVPLFVRLAFLADVGIDTSKAGGRGKGKVP